VMDDDRMLRESLQVKPLSAAALSRIRAVTESEWRANLVERRPRRWLPYAAAAILLALMSAGGLFLAGVGREDLGEPAARESAEATPSASPARWASSTGAYACSSASASSAARARNAAAASVG